MNIVQWKYSLFMQRGQYLYNCLNFELVEDDYSNGEKLGTERNWSLNYNINGSSIKEVISKFADEIGNDDLKNKDYWDFDSNDYSIVGSVTCDENYVKPSKDMIDRWKKGKEKLYTLYAWVEICGRISSNEIHNQWK